MEAPVPRQEMQRYTALKTCLRRPCMWGQQCRMLHVSVGKQHAHSELKNEISRELCRRAEKMLESPACRGRDKHAEDRATAPKTRCGQEEGQGPVPRQNEEEIKVTKKLAKEELQEDQIKEQEQFPGAESCQVSCGEIGQEAQEKVGGQWLNPHHEFYIVKNVETRK